MSHWSEVHRITGHGYPEAPCTCQLCDGVTAVVRRAALAEVDVTAFKHMCQAYAIKLEAQYQHLRGSVDLIEHLTRQRKFSLKTFGPGDASQRFAGIRDHIEKELKELEVAPHDLEEWIDVVLLALDGAWRTGAVPSEIAAMLLFKQDKNEKRKWPAWESAEVGKAIEHLEE